MIMNAGRRCAEARGSYSHEDTSARGEEGNSVGASEFLVAWEEYDKHVWKRVVSRLESVGRSVSSNSF